MTEKQERANLAEPVYSPAPIALKQLPAQRKPAKRYVIASGHSLCGTRKGQLRAGTEVTAADLFGGDAQLAELVASHVVVASR